MTKLMEEIEAKIKECGGNYWHMDIAKAQKIGAKMTVAEANEFMGEVFAKVKAKKFGYVDVLERFIGAVTELHKLVEADTLEGFVENVIDHENAQMEILRVVSKFDNLPLDSMKAMLEYEKARTERWQATHDKNDDYIGGLSVEPDNERHISGNTLESLIRHKNMTQEYMDTLASESSEGFIHRVAEQTKNPETLMRCARIASKDDGRNYYTTNLCIENKITTPEMLAEIAQMSEGSAVKVLSSRRCPKHLIAEIAKTASGDSARTILQAGKTPVEILEALIDANDDPSVLQGIAINRSKKVTPAMLMKAYAKIPNQGYYWIKCRFLKRSDMVDIVSNMAQQVTGLKPTYVEPPDPDMADDPDQAVA